MGGLWCLVLGAWVIHWGFPAWVESRRRRRWNVGCGQQERLSSNCIKARTDLFAITYSTSYRRGKRATSISQRRSVSKCRMHYTAHVYLPFQLLLLRNSENRDKKWCQATKNKQVQLYRQWANVVAEWLRRWHMSRARYGLNCYLVIWTRVRIKTFFF